MGRLILLILLIAAIWLVWRAFGPSSWKQQAQHAPEIKGPDDDPNFLWELEKQRFKRERDRIKREEELKRQRERRDQGKGGLGPQGPGGAAEN
ncbi:hypothetical protein [Corynebacterium gerontici]|uniref:Uncharacterized protein n=1 Tax=Corynebacterium gerontici TaxID=2079234 RepID=A0A3G6J3D8_9CORY|nr:hypothetical protein [Corynebacterium gerontici]AZA12213.1 hypothetical protein CGERO_09630 [Corynebacterium gerontici]